MALTLELPDIEELYVTVGMALTLELPDIEE